MIDWILQSHCDFFWAYIDDIVIYIKLKSLNNHLSHLDEVFKFLTEKEICLSSTKSFLSYFTVQLLDQCVDALRLAITEDKLVTIVNIEFSQTLSALKKYLDMTEYLQQYIPYYAAIIRPLQKKKTQLNHRLQKSWSE